MERAPDTDLLGFGLGLGVSVGLVRIGIEPRFLPRPSRSLVYAARAVPPGASQDMSSVSDLVANLKFLFNALMEALN
jgi:hypothetical protein